MEVLMTTRLADKDSELLEKRFRKSPQSRLFSRLADNYRKEGNLSRAIELCLEGIQNHPDYVTGHIILGRCYFEQQNYNDAFNEFKKVCTIDRHNQVALKMLAEIFVQQNMIQKAGSIYEILYKMDPYNKSIAKLASQYPSDGISGLYETLGIEIPAEPVLWEPTPVEQPIADEQMDYGNEVESDNFYDESFPPQQSIDEDQSFPPDIPFDNEKTVSIDGDMINQHANILYEENHQPQDYPLDSFTQENSNNEEIQNLESSIIDEAVLDEDADITGQDISSRIDELFSEKTDSFNNSTLKAMPQIISEEDSPVNEQLVHEKTIALDPSMIPLDSNEQSPEPESSLEQQSDLIIEQPRPFEDIDSFTGKNILSEFEETMQFERSFLENVIDTNETLENNEISEKTEPFINQDLNAEVPDQQNSTDPSEDPFDPSQILVDANKDEVSQSDSDIENSNDQVSLIQTDEQQSPEPFLSQTQDPDQNLIIDSDDAILEKHSESNLNLPEIELINDEDSLSLEPEAGSATMQMEESDSHQDLDDVLSLDKDQETLVSEELSDQIQSASDSSFIENIDDSLLPDSQEDILDQVFPETGSELTTENNELQQSQDQVEKTDNFIQESLDQNNISHAEIDDFDASDDLQNIDIAPDLPILEDELNSAPEQFVSLADENERDILIDSEEIDSSEQDESSVIDSTPVKEETVQPEDMGSILPDQINNDSDNLAIIDADSEIEQLSVEHDDEVLTDMDVLVSDEVLNTVSGDDIVEKMDMLFPDNKNSSEAEPVENLSVTEDSDSLSLTSSIEDSPDSQDQGLSIISDPESFAQTEYHSPPQETASNDDISVEIISKGSEPADDAGENDEQETTTIISGQDVMDRLEQFFPDKDLINTDSELLPTDDNESEDVQADFYTIFGDNAVNAQGIEELDKLDQLEMSLPEQSDKPLSFYDEWNDVCSLQDQNENETFKEKVEKSVEKSFNENISIDQSPAEEADENCRPYSIPDHVLTPTLADIYFQQGQHDLAIQIYKRLLSRDPDNENLQQKLNQLMESAAGIASNNLSQDKQTIKKAESTSSPAKKRKVVVDNRPLAGVRIKKRKNGSANRSKTK